MRLVTVIKGDEELQRRFDGIEGRAADLTGAWEKVIPQFRSHEREIFATKGHGIWPPNSPRTIARKGRDQPLVDTGRLQRALTANRASGSFTRRQKTQMVFGVNDDRIPYANFLGEVRPFIIGERTAGKIGAKAVEEYLMRGDS